MSIFDRNRRRKPSDEYMMGRQNSMLPRWTHPPERNARDWLAMYGKSPRLAVVERIASDLSFASGRLYVLDSDGNEHEIQNHSFLDFWAHPNPLYEFTSASLWKLEEIYLLLKGEGYFVIERDAAGRPSELWPVPTHWVQMTPYLNHPYYTIRTASGFTMEVPVDDMYCEKDLNPLDPYMRGLGQAESVADEVEIDEYAAQFQKRFFYNDATPNIIVSMPGSTDDQRKRFRAEWLERFKGVFKSHGIATVGGEISVQKLSESMKDLDMTNGRIFLRDAVLEHFGVPREIMGITESSNRATSEAAQYIYAQNVLMARLRRREEAINQQLLPAFGDNLVWKFDDIVPKNQDFDKQKALDGWNAGLLTKNEARELLNMPAAETGGDVYKTTFSDMFIHADEDPAGISSSMMQMQYGEPTPDVGVTQAEPTAQPDSVAVMDSSQQQDAAAQPNNDTVEITALGGKAKKAISLRKLVHSEDAAAQESISAFEIATMKYFREQSRRIGAALGATQKADTNAWDVLSSYMGDDGTVNREAWDALSTENQNALLNQFVTGLIDWPGEADALSKIFEPLWRKAYAAGASQAQSTYGLMAVNQPQLVSTAKLRGGQRIVGIEDATKNEIAQIVASGIENGDSTSAMADSIIKTMGTNQQRAQLIARQETMTSLSTGQFDMMEAAGAQTKTWHHMSRTPDYRRDHQHMDGETVPYNAKFSNGLRFPRDPDGPADEVINCRCIMTPNF